MTAFSELGKGTRGVWTRREALAVASRSQIGRLVSSGQWQRAWPGVYGDGGMVLDPEQRAFAAVLASGGSAQPAPDAAGRRWLRAVACRRTAARMYGLMLIDDDDPLTGAADHLHDAVAGWSHLDSVRQPSSDRGLLLPDGRALAGARVLHRYYPAFRAGDVVQTGSGLWVTSLERTIMDCARILTFEAIVCLLDDALHRGLLAVKDLHRWVTASGGQPGIEALRRAAAASDGRAESPAESLARLLLLPLLPGLLPQVSVWDSSGRLVARFDLACEVLGLAVELDGRRFHAGEVMRAKDTMRDRRTDAMSWMTERGTWWDVRRGQREFVARVVARARLRSAA